MQKILQRLDILLVVIIIGLIILINYISSKEDKVAPKISFSSKTIEVSTKATTEDLLVGVSAADDKDGDVTKSLSVENISDFNSDGTRTITYSAFDNSYNISFAERKVSYTDYVPPRFSLKGSTTFSTSDSAMNLANIISAEDVFDGDITSFIKLNKQNIVIGQSGEYKATVSVYNSAGDSSSLEIPIFIKPPLSSRNESPVIKLKEYLIYVKKGEKTPKWEDYIESVEDSPNSRLKRQQKGEDESEQKPLKVTVDDDNVNLDKPGCYYVTYQTINENDAMATERLIVAVED